MTHSKPASINVSYSTSRFFWYSAMLTEVLLEACHQALKQGRCVDKTEHPVGDHKAGDEELDILDVRRYGDIADALAGQRKVLGV